MDPILVQIHDQSLEVGVGPGVGVGESIYGSYYLLFDEINPCPI